MINIRIVLLARSFEEAQENENPRSKVTSKQFPNNATQVIHCIFFSPIIGAFVVEFQNTST